MKCLTHPNQNATICSMCDQPVAGCHQWKTSVMPGIAFYYYCEAHFKQQQEQSGEYYMTYEEFRPACCPSYGSEVSSV